MVQMCRSLAAIPLLKAWSCRQGIRSQLATGSSGWVEPDSPGQSYVLLGGAELAGLTQGRGLWRLRLQWLGPGALPGAAPAQAG